MTVRRRSEDGRWITYLRALALSLILFAAPLAVEAQTGKVWRIGVLTGSTAQSSPRWVPFREALREFGYVDGQNIALEWRSSGFRAERFPDLAAELVRLKVDVIVAGDNPAIAAAQKATRTVPIVMVLAMDPVASGFAGSLARPGGNITGLTVQGTDLQGKTLQLLKEAVPTASRVAVLWGPDRAWSPSSVEGSGGCRPRAGAAASASGGERRRRG